MENESEVKEKRISEVEDSVDKQFAEFTQRIGNLEDNRLEEKNTVLVAGEDKINNEDIINLRAEIEKKLEHSSVLSMFFDFTNILAQLDDATAHRDATIWMEFLYEKNIRKLVANHTELDFMDYRRTNLVKNW